ENLTAKNILIADETGHRSRPSIPTASFLGSMHTDEVMDKLLKEVILRKLPCNSVLELRMFLQISNKIIENLVQFPSEHKYRTLRWNNTAIHSRIISVHGGLEFLDLLGFKKIKREGVQILEINDCTDDSGRLLALKQWLRYRKLG
ncbi:unnamed protein product, partial [Heterosigma akashiwo]